MGNLASAQRAYDNVIPMCFESASNEAVRCAATAYLEALMSGRGTARMPLAGVTKSADIATMLTWLSPESSSRLLAACSAAMTGRDTECVALLKSFAAQAAAEYAADNFEVWL